MSVNENISETTMQMKIDVKILYRKIVCEFRKMGRRIHYYTDDVCEFKKTGKCIYYYTDDCNKISADCIPKEINKILKSAKPLFEENIISYAKFYLKNDKYKRIVVKYSKKNKDNLPCCVIDIYRNTNCINIRKINHDTSALTLIPQLVKLKTLLFFEDGAYTKIQEKSYPISIKDISCLEEPLQKIIMSMYANNNAYKDFISEKFYPPIKLINLSEYHNKKEYLENMFKIDLPKSANKLSFKWLYSVCCVSSYIPREQFSIIYNNRFCNYDELDFKPSIRNKKTIAKQYLEMFFKNRIPHLDENIIYDYIEMAMETKTFIDVSASKKKLCRLHDELIAKSIEKANRGKKLVIPETPLKYLKLPKEFVLIKTKKALEFEGQRNHNCVGTYLNRINNGECIIYTADIKGEHLTIEICCKKRGRKNITYKFYVPQCYKSYNRTPYEETTLYINECVQSGAAKAIKDFEKKQALLIQKK